MLRRTKLQVLTAAALLTFCIILYNSDYFSSNYFERRVLPETFRARSHLIFTEGCKIPRFDPFDPTVADYYQKVSGDLSCPGKKYVSLRNDVVTLNESEVRQDFGGRQFSCTYKPILRNPKNEPARADRKFGYGEEKVLNFNQSLPSEFVKVTCKVEGDVKYEDFFACAPIKPAVEERCLKNSAQVKRKDALNIIMVGIDSVSKLNFERHFRLTADYVRRNLSAFEFHGYVKVADNTFPNLTPLLTGHFIAHYYNESNRWRYFDDLDFIWKNFSSVGYRTLYAEDAPDMGTFQYSKSGFRYPPTDYFFRPFTLAIEDTPWQQASNKHCFQANPEIVVLFNYLRSFLNSMENRRHFSLTFASRLTHGKLNLAGYADKPTLDLLRDIHDAGHLNRSALVFFSDHGLRYGEIRHTFIGKIEERLPFLFISLPAWFLDAHPEIRVNLESNQKRLTTPFDLHETLVDLYQWVSGDESYVRTPYGVSLFREIPAGRNCEDAFILPHWCVCHGYAKLDARDKMAQGAAKQLVSEVNAITEPRRRLCAELTLDAILDVRVSQPEEDLLRFKELVNGSNESSIVYGEKSDSYEKLLVTVRTKPGGAEFESTIRRVKKRHFKVFDISRINVYGHTGDCVDDAYLRKFCYCG